MMLMPQPSSDREIDGDGVRITKSFSFSSPRSRTQDSLPTPPDGTPLKFHLITTEDHGGYMMSFSRARIDHFRRILDESGIHRMNVEECCNAILSKSSDSTLTKEGFDSAVSSLTSWEPGASSESRRTLSTILDGIFHAFDAGERGDPSVMEVACGMTVLCQGKKSDKLEFAFEVLDKNKRGQLSKSDMIKYLQSFLTVLLSIAFSPSLSNDPNADSVRKMNGEHCARTVTTIRQAVESGAEWAASLAFRAAEGRQKNGESSMSFDDFADWYTTKGFSNIPWLELIDLRKWVIVSSA